jgi:hypothetical protein
LVKEVGLSRPLNSDASDAAETLLSSITPDPDRLPIWIWIVAVSSMEGPFVIAKKPEEVVVVWVVVVFQKCIPGPFVISNKLEEVMVGWAVVVFQKCTPGPVLLCARPRPSKKTVTERVEMCMAMVKERNPEKSLLLVQGEKQVIS